MKRFRKVLALVMSVGVIAALLTGCGRYFCSSSVHDGLSRFDPIIH